MSLDGWTLEVDWLGKTWTWDGIRATLTERMELYSDEPTFRSVSVSVIFEGVNVATQYAIGHRLEGAPARLILDGVTYLRGTVDTPRFSGLHYLVAFTVREVPWDDTGVFPPKVSFLREVVDEEATLAERTEIANAFGYTYAEALAIVGEETFAAFTVFSTRAVGYLYPYVFG